MFFIDPRRGPSYTHFVLGRITNVLLIIFQALLLNVVVPGHTRGMVTVAGTARSDLSLRDLAGGTRCCPTHKGGHQDQKKQTTPEERSNCAFCFVAARFTPPPIIDLTPPLRLAGWVAPPVPAARPAMPFIPFYDGRAPPTV
jgi:hypothetical protein